MQHTITVWRQLQLPSPDDDVDRGCVNASGQSIPSQIIKKNSRILCWIFTILVVAAETFTPPNISLFRWYLFCMFCIDHLHDCIRCMQLVVQPCLPRHHLLASYFDSMRAVESYSIRMKTTCCLCLFVARSPLSNLSVLLYFKKNCTLYSSHPPPHLTLKTEKNTENSQLSKHDDQPGIYFCIFRSTSKKSLRSLLPFLVFCSKSFAFWNYFR